jgi:MOB kinase activator 1
MSLKHDRMDYTWIDASRKRVKLPAPQYIDYVLTWVEGLIKDEAVFPTNAGRDFSPNFPSVARHIYTQLLRIFAHLYHAHYPIFLHLSSEGHLNSLFAHFLTFGREFDLLEEKETRAPKEGYPFVVEDLMDVRFIPLSPFQFHSTDMVPFAECAELERIGYP